MFNLYDLLMDIQNWMQQAQQVIEEAGDRKGAAILHGMGERLLARVDTGIDILAE